jgi:ABC-2 type transport system permease protein
MSALRLLAVAWSLQLKMRSRSAFDGVLSLLWPLFFATSILLMYRESAAGEEAMLSAAVGTSVMGIWSATSTTAAFALQTERRQGTLELLVACPRPFPLLILPLTLSIATIGAYGMVVTLLWGRLVFGIDIAVRDPAMFIAGVVVTVIAIAVMGFVIAVSSVRYRAAWALGAALELPVWLICGFLISISSLPAWVRPVSWLLAPTWGMSAIRAATEGRSASLYLAACVGLTVVYAVIGTVVARVLLDSARREATLALS